MKTLQEKYNLVKEGKFSKTQFVRDARLTAPSIITALNNYEDSVRILKNRGLISENSLEDLQKERYPQPEDKFSIDEVERGIDFELEKAGHSSTNNIPKEAYQKAKDRVLKNLEKNKNFYLDLIAGKKEGARRTDKPVEVNQKELFKGSDNKGTKASGNEDKDNGMKKVKVPMNESAKDKYNFIIIISDYGFSEYLKIPRAKFKEHIDYLKSHYYGEEAKWTTVPYSSANKFKDSSSLIKDIKKEKGEDETKPAINPTKKQKITEEVILEGFTKLIKNIVTESYNDLKQAIIDAQEESKEGYAVHVNQVRDGVYKLSDWYDDEQTIVSFENGRRLNEQKQSKKKILKEAKTESLENYVNYENPDNEELAGRIRKGAKNLQDMVEKIDRDFINDREKIEKIYAEIGSFMGPALAKAFHDDLEPVLVKYYKIDIPKSRKLTQDEMDAIASQMKDNGEEGLTEKALTMEGRKTRKYTKPKTV